MEEIDRMRFLSWRPEFVLTEAWTPLGRHVRFIGQGKSGDAVLQERYLVTDAETPEVEPAWESSETGGAPESAAWAKASNDDDVQRAWDQLVALRAVGEHVRPSEETEGRVRFLESALNVFVVWYARMGLPSPIGLNDATGDSPAVPALRSPQRGHEHAEAAYEHLGKSASLKGLWGTMNGGQNAGYEAFLRAVTRAGFYPQGADMSPGEKLAAFEERVRAYVDRGEWPN